MSVTADRARRELTAGCVRHHLVRLTLPMALGILALLSQSVVDTWFVSRLGTEALSALSFTFPVALAVSSLAIGLGAGAASVVARTIGGGDWDLVRRQATDALFLSLLLVAAAAAIGLATIRPLFGLLGAHGAVLELIEGYMAIWYVGLAFVVVPMVGNGLIRAAGDARIPGLIMVTAAVLNAIVDPLLIFGLGPFPALGLAGAAWASLIANLAAALLGLAALQWRERLLVWTLPGFRPVLASWRRVLHVGLPAAGANMINPIGVGVVTALLAREGQDVVAAFGVATRIETLAVVAMLALSSSIGPVVGQNRGRGLDDRVGLALRHAYRFCLAYGLAIALLLALLAPAIAGVFTSSESVARLTRLYLWIVPVTLWGYGVNIVAAAALNASGKPFDAVGLTFARMGLAYLPLALLLAALAGTVGVFFAAAIANLVAGWLGLRVSRRKLAGDHAGLP